MVAVVIVAANVCFPIPFTVITMVPVFYVIGIVVNYIIVGVTVVRAVLADREPLMRFSSFIATQQMLSLIYPAYQVLFNAASNTDYELPIILLLPVIKLALKNLALRCVTHMEDMMPEAVIFTVDFFNALYMATSVQEMNSQPTITIIVLIDIAQSATVLFRLYQRTATILVRLGKASGTAGTLLDGIYWICNNEDSFKRQKRQQIQIRSALRTTFQWRHAIFSVGWREVLVLSLRKVTLVLSPRLTLTKPTNRVILAKELRGYIGKIEAYFFQSRRMIQRRPQTHNYSLNSTVKTRHHTRAFSEKP
ncbi:hypothetical protein ON010_g13626 [Phytophthora cinnamomi]|nr:hypothetical protein ON010_g13626 [Phytophthora cinnamomi]